MIIPPRVTIAGREFVIEAKRSEKLAGGGRGSWAKQGITLYYGKNTTAGEVYDSLLHECIELWAHGRNAHWTNSEDVMMLIRHGDLREFCGMLVMVASTVTNLNGGNMDPTARWEPAPSERKENQ